MDQPSPFLNAGPRTSANTLAIAHLSRDNLQPIILQDPNFPGDDGYAEGIVLNTRFGSFPHSTLVGVPWGSQIRASAVDTGSRGRKRKRETTDEESKDSTPGVEDTEGADLSVKENGISVKKAVTAQSGFIHILPPTPELWTMSLPHRTQVVYTPDYSYILQRIRARPGTRLIEAGAGSGSFTHASARAVYSGYPISDGDKRGKVFSFEFHKSRFEKMKEEIKAHGLEGIVQITHRDVYREGFLVDGVSPQATAVFLDLPAPWEALPHLSRRRPQLTEEDGTRLEYQEWISPLDPARSVYICTFSPCIEQVTRTISALRSLGWVEINMVEISHKRLNVLRERIGRNMPAERGAAQTPADVAEAVVRLKEIEKRTKEYHAQANTSEPGSPLPVPKAAVESGDGDVDEMELDDQDGESVKPWMQGRLVHRAEPELKTHTSYLVFAILPREWSEEQEAAALAAWPCGNEKKVIGSLDKEARRQEKRELLQTKKKKRKHSSPYIQRKGEPEASNAS